MSDDIVQLEWEFFQHVQHIDGRASCQDDFETFYLQRKSQFDAFDQDVQQACLQDLKVAKQMGRNPVMEKYAYMMESTDPDYYQTIQDQLPQVDPQKRAFIQILCEIEVSMREDMNEKTYSDETLYLYGQMVLRMVQNQENLIEKILTNTVKAYGYSSLEEANNFMKESQKQ